MWEALRERQGGAIIQSMMSSPFAGLVIEYILTPAILVGVVLLYRVFKRAWQDEKDSP